MSTTFAWSESIRKTIKKMKSMEPLSLPPAAMSIQQKLPDGDPNYGALSVYNSKQKQKVNETKEPKQCTEMEMDPYTYSQLQYQRQYEQLLLKQQQIQLHNSQLHPQQITH
eukprot:114397_1